MSATKSLYRRPPTLAAIATGALVALAATACTNGSGPATGGPAQSSAATSAVVATSPSVTAPAPHAAEAAVMTAASQKDFNATVEALKTAVSDNGMMILGELDQANALRATGLNLAGAHTFLVGNPSVGKMFFEKNPAIGTVLPLQMLVWADNDGAAHVSYFNPEPLFAAVDPMLADGGKKMSGAAAMIAKAATGGEAGSPGAGVAAELKTVDAKGSFDDTVSAFKQSVSSNGMMILGDVDQANALRTAGLDVAGAHTFFVGNPSVGKMFFEKTPAIGTVLPMRMEVWQGSDGKSHVSYFDPKPMFAAVDPMLADGGQKMSDAAAMVTKAVA